jgi:hypothetical protein
MLDFKTNPTPQFPVICSSCAVTLGMPISARTTVGSGDIAVEVQCSDCLHQWQIAIAPPNTRQPAHSTDA